MSLRLTATAAPTPTPAEDRLDGAGAIATYLGWNKKKVYNAWELRWSVPIRKRDGLGLYAFKTELDAWMKAPETLNH
jgi:hypothetical protein